MPKLPLMRDGEELTAHRRSVPFSFWPTGVGVPRPPVQSLLFAIDPWVVMRREVITQVSEGAARSEALSYIEQAEDFYASALSSSINAAKPVQLYYSYLNIAKAFIICRSQLKRLPEIRHGINEGVAVGGLEVADGYVQFWQSPNQNKTQAYDEFLHALGVKRAINGMKIPITHLVPQIIAGHRLWAMAAGVRDRFIAVENIQFIQGNGQLWLRLYLVSSDVLRLGCTQEQILTESDLSIDFRKVRYVGEDDRNLIVLEQMVPLKFRRHGVDIASELAMFVKGRLWMTVSTTPPYRRFYLYLSPPAERTSTLPQLASIYAMTFYLGSVTRYRPNAFQELLNGPYGPRIAEFVSGQPAQFVYLMASEFAKRDVTRPSIV